MQKYNPDLGPVSQRFLHLAWTLAKSGADFTKGLKPSLRLKFKSFVLNFVNRMLKSVVS